MILRLFGALASIIVLCLIVLSLPDDLLARIPQWAYIVGFIAGGIFLLWFLFWLFGPALRRAGTAIRLPKHLGRWVLGMLIVAGLIWLYHEGKLSSLLSKSKREIWDDILGGVAQAISFLGSLPPIVWIGVILSVFLYRIVKTPKKWRGTSAIAILAILAVLLVDVPTVQQRWHAWWNSPSSSTTTSSASACSSEVTYDIGPKLPREFNRLGTCTYVLYFDQNVQVYLKLPDFRSNSDWQGPYAWGHAYLDGGESIKSTTEAKVRVILKPR